MCGEEEYLFFFCFFKEKIFSSVSTSQLFFQFKKKIECVRDRSKDGSALKCNHITRTLKAQYRTKRRSIFDAKKNIL